MRSGVSISVIIRTLDRSALLREALESLARQTRRDFEAVIVDMSDGQAALVLKPYYERLPHIQHLRVGRPLSRAEALNQGIRNAAADKIAILDDDNLYDPAHLEVLIQGLERTDADLVYTGVSRITYNQTHQLIDSAEWHHPYDFTELLRGNYIHTAGTAFWKRTWERLGGYDPRFPVWEDYEFLLRVGATGRIECLPAVTAESRSFTGQPGIQNHVFGGYRPIRRCQAGIHWLHRDHYTTERRAAHAETLRAQGISQPRISLPARLFRRGRMMIDLLGWWWFYPRRTGEDPFRKELA